MTTDAPALQVSSPDPAGNDRVLLVTGATGLVGSHVADRARKLGWRVRALCRMNSDIRLLQNWGVEIVTGSMVEPYAIQAAVQGATHIVHAAAMLGDWGPVQKYRDVNVTGFEHLLEAASRSETLQRLVDISTQGVYPVRDHFGTDETEPMHEGVDGYTTTKVEAEKLLLHYVRREKLPGVIIRPGWIYGPRDRTVIPNVLEKMEQGKFRYLGTGEQIISNTYVGNLVDAIFLALEREGVIGEAFNITDGRLVTKLEFFNTIAEKAGLPIPERHVPMWLAMPLAKGLEFVWRACGINEAPILSMAKIKLLGLNLDYSIEKARTRLGYDPQVDFQEAMQTTMEWFNKRRQSA